MFTMQNNETSGVDCAIIIGDENVDLHLLRNTHIQPSGFTAHGHFTEERLSAFLKAAKKKHRVKIAIFLGR
jgi:hypothetical protein